MLDKPLPLQKRFWKASCQLCQSVWLVAAKVNGKKGAYSTLCCFGSMSQPQSRFSLDTGWIADLQGVLPALQISDKGGDCGTFAMEMAVNYNCSQEKQVFHSRDTKPGCCTQFCACKVKYESSAPQLTYPKYHGIRQYGSRFFFSVFSTIWSGNSIFCITHSTSTEWRSGLLQR